MGSGYPALLDRRSCGAYNASKYLCKLFHKSKIILASHSSSAGYDDLGFLEVDALSDLFYSLNDLCADILCCHILICNLSAPALIQILCEGSGTDSRDMRKVLSHLHVV